MSRREMLAGAAAAAVTGTAAEAARGSYPPVAELQNQLPCHPGDRLGKLISWRGRVLQPVFLRAEERPGGTYVVTLRLEEYRG